MDKVVAPIEPSTTSETNDTGDLNDNNTAAAMNDEELENPIWSIVAPRQKLSSTNNNVPREEQMRTKAPPVEMFRPQQLNVKNQCIQCQKTLQEKERLQTSHEDTACALKDVTKEKRKLEEEIEKLRLEMEVMKMKIDSDNDKCGGGGGLTALQQQHHEHNGGRKNSWQPTTPAPVDLATATTTPAAVASSRPPMSNETTASSHQHPTDGAVDEMAHIVSQVVAAAFATTDTRSAPSFIWEKRSKLFDRCSSKPKPNKSQKNLNLIIKALKNDPTLVNIRSGNMPPLPDGYTLLHAAVYAGNQEVLEYLLKEYVVVDPTSRRPIIDLNERDLQGRTALHICAEFGHTELLLVLERAYKDLEAIKEVKNEEESDGEDGEGLIDKLDTTPVTPGQQPRARNKSKQKSHSPKPPSSHFSPKFSGPAAPIDLAGRTPLGYSATSPMPKAKNNRALSEKILFKSGDRSIVGERTPPRERSGGLFTPPRQGGGRKKVGFRKNDSVISDSGGESGDVIVETGLTSYLSPTPRKTIGRKATPFHNNMSLSSAMKAVPEETVRNSIAWGAAEMNGFRIEMEDAILCQYPLEVPPKPLSTDGNETPSSSATVSTMGIFGVFDGHGDGGFASQFISSKLISKLQSNPDWNVAYHEINSASDSCTTDTLETIFTESCYDLDDDLKKESSKPRDGGTTAIVALVSSHKILVANVGDSRCILVKKRNATNNHDEGQENKKMSQIEVIPMSEDHKPDLPDERARIESAGLEIHTDVIAPSEDDEIGQYETISKVKKSDTEMLGVARAFGDYDYKSNEDLSSSRQAVVCTPDIVSRDRADSDDLFLILACDGVWDVMSNDEVGLFVTEGVNSAAAALAKEYQPAEADVLATVGDGLLDECLKKGSTDNMSVLIVALPASGLSFGGNAAVTARALAFE